jgi:hypothetical protein
VNHGLAAAADVVAAAVAGLGAEQSSGPSWIRFYETVKDEIYEQKLIWSYLCL